jgi:hypothetical protein
MIMEEKVVHIFFNCVEWFSGKTRGLEIFMAGLKGGYYD